VRQNAKGSEAALGACKRFLQKQQQQGVHVYVCVCECV
jgi:hypothetical protein